MKKATLPAGTYHIADPCHLLSGSNWNAFCDLTMYDWNDGIVELNGHKLVVFRTAWGDGDFAIDDPIMGHTTVDVDSGVIGIVPENLCANPHMSSNHFASKDAVSCSWDPGKTVKINAKDGEIVTENPTHLMNVTMSLAFIFLPDFLTPGVNDEKAHNRGTDVRQEESLRAEAAA